MRTFPYYFAASGLIGAAIINLIEPPARPSIGWFLFHSSCLALAAGFILIGRTIGKARSGDADRS